MQKKYESFSFQLMMMLLFAAVLSRTHFQLEHPTHQEFQKRHSLANSHRKFIIRHDMRAFKSNHLLRFRHNAAISETYGLNDMGYFFTLNLTIAGLPYRLNIDTGSSDIFIKGQGSPGQPRTRYSCRSCYQNNKKMTIAYLDGQLKTYQANLEVQLGVHKFNQSILVAFTAPRNFEHAEGLVGLSFPALARNKDPTFLQTLINNKIITSYSFGVNLNFQQHKRSFITFGSPSRQHYQGQLKQYPLASQNSYVIKTKGFSVGDKVLFRIGSALFDTGNTCISIPKFYQKQILKRFNTKGNSCGFDKQQYAPIFSLLRCRVKNYNELPSIKIYIQSEVYEIDKDVYMQRCVKDSQGDKCDTFIQSVTGHNSIFLGDGFFNRYYTYFDLISRKIGIAKNKEVLSYKNMYVDQSNLDDEDNAFFQKLRIK